jgi:hypothetical protein
MKRLLVIEDGDEYTEFARLFLGADLAIRQARSLAQTLAALAAEEIFALLIDLRFDRATPESLCGDLAATAAQLFGGDQARALRYLKDQQGALILAQVRAHGYGQPAVFIHDFPPRRLQNLQRLYGRVTAVPSFDAGAIRQALAEPSR